MPERPVPLCICPAHRPAFQLGKPWAGGSLVRHQSRDAPEFLAQGNHERNVNVLSNYASDGFVHSHGSLIRTRFLSNCRVTDTCSYTVLPIFHFIISWALSIHQGLYTERARSARSQENHQDVRAERWGSRARERFLVWAAGQTVRLSQRQR